MQTVINYLHTFAQVLVYLFIFAIFVRAAASWFVRDNHSRVMGFLLDVTEPILGPLRRVLPAALGVDFSPMIAILVLYVLGQFLG
ncbi:MAG: YggT family protein [Chloroflexi bacterium]|nr:MAG: YggT family protein [Chloroflexota bacterium]TME46851.1 MAG: YggT family protein [Chloroflexota bacterium]